MGGYPYSNLGAPGLDSQVIIEVKCCYQPIALIQLGSLAKGRIGNDKLRCGKDEFSIVAKSLSIEARGTEELAVCS